MHFQSAWSLLLTLKKGHYFAPFFKGHGDSKYRLHCQESPPFAPSVLFQQDQTQVETLARKKTGEKKKQQQKQQTQKRETLARKNREKQRPPMGMSENHEPPHTGGLGMSGAHTTGVEADIQPPLKARRSRAAFGNDQHLESPSDPRKIGSLLTHVSWVRKKQKNVRYRA